MFVSDLRHFLDMPPDAPGPARNIAEQLTSVVRAATSEDAGAGWVSALPCRRRPGRRACPGHLAVLRTDVPPSIEWQCVSCGDDGVISGWERSPFDLRPRRADPPATRVLRVVVAPEVAATLRSLMLLDPATERVVFGARASEGGVMMAGAEDDLDDLVAHLAAAADSETDRRRRKRLVEAFSLLDDALNDSEDL